MGRFPNPIAASRDIPAYTQLREQIYRDPSLWRIYAELQQQIYRHARLWKRDIISAQPCSSFSTQIKKVATAVAVLVSLVWFWFGVSTHRTPHASYPYYDTQKPVPPWSEPLPLEGNYDRVAQHK